MALFAFDGTNQDDRDAGSSIDPLHEFDLPDTVAYCFHAMALDERRTSFINRRIAGAYEVWFRGVHSDIGGGNDNPGLEYVALRWMFRKAIARACR